MSYAQRAATEDCGARYEQLRQTFVALVRAAGPEELDRAVPATPAWRVRDVLAHVTGLTQDLNGGDIGPGDPHAWTARQVDRFRSGTVDAVITAWDHEAPTFEDGLRLFGYQLGNHFVGDLFVHLTDVQVALGQPVDQDGIAMWIALDWYLDSLGETLAEAHVGALAVESGPETRIVGPGDVAASVTVEPFEMLRACAGRRTLAEIRAFAWSGDVDAFVGRLSRYETPATGVGA